MTFDPIAADLAVRAARATAGSARPHAPVTVTTAAPTPARDSVTVAGSLQSELGCPGDWQPDCAATHLAFDTSDGLWHATFALPAGSYEW
ncbi:hypothetical protein ACFP8W_25655, partial [Nocardioides hankookensis]